nr:hypothetical protein [Kibdelosporangium sp. MJ126-NF4]
MVRTLPFLIAGYFVLNLLPVPTWSIYLALGGALCYSVFVLVASGDDMAESRLVQHGFPPGFGRHTRKAEKA